AKAKLANAKAHLDFTKIKAPFDGIMGRLHERKGSLVEEGDKLTGLYDNSKMWVYFNVPEAEYLNYMANTKRDSTKKVKLQLANNKVYDYSGKVTVIEAEFNNETGNIAFRATFPNPKGLLRHGETGNILWPVPLKDALLIPQKATYEILTQKYVYVVDKKDKVHLRKITIDKEIPDLFAIKNGLKENEKILFEGIRQVRNEEKITYKYQQPDSVFSHLKVYTE
ncbi:MAG: efflux RND transporter periplasmic adaptor subunit, partial [Flavobacteriales bacterium]